MILIIRKMRLITVFIVLVTIAISGIACGPDEAPATKPAPPSATGPSGNRPPVISSLTPAQIQVYPSGLSEIQCVVSDPDGDKVNITWSATGGKFSGAGNVVTWQAPEQYGTYEITATADDGKGGSTQSTITLSVGANQNPQISSLAADPSTIGPGGTTTVTCIATDPDGDVVTYNWKASEGSITGVGNKITWIAPGKSGTFNVMVVVSDGKGGKHEVNVGVTVATATKTVTINIVKEETGTVDSNGDKDKSFTRAGDNEKNVGYRAFWSFNIWSLQGSVIKDARLLFTTRNIAGKPFTKVGAQSLGGLRLWRVSYSDTLPSFNITGTKLEKARATLDEQPTVVDVTPEIGHLVQAASTRFQTEALFLKETNGNGVSEWIEWSDVKLEVTYTEK
jgi:hypothetical protein